MWLLDVNMPHKLILLLGELGIETETARSRGWDTLNNGRLVEAAAGAGFSCLLTRDKLFGESSARTLDQFPQFAIVVVTLPQLREERFLSAFREAWNATPILLVPGRVIDWP